MIQSWDEWFRACGDRFSDVKNYEADVKRLFSVLYGKNSRDTTARLYSPLNTAFYKQEKRTFIKRMPLYALTSLPIALIMFGIVCVVIMVLGGIDATKSIEATAELSRMSIFFGGFKGALVSGLLYGALSMILVTVCAIVFKFLRFNSIAGSLSKRETSLLEFIKTIPPKYRNSYSLEYFSALHYEYPYVTFEQAIENCDDYLRKVDRNIKAIMYDTPYGRQALSNTPSAYTQSSDTSDNTKTHQKDDFEIPESVLKNPNLPQDISTKIFHGSDDAQKELTAMIGLDGVKQQVNRLKNRMSLYGGTSNSGNHMVFMGSAGTGKTTVARIITRILYDFGYIKQNKCVEVDGDYLKSPYKGQTGERTSAIVDYAMNGVLFIDEAYLLYDKSNPSSGEATGVLLKAMEDHRQDFVVIFAGYEEQMTRLLAANEGFASRIKHKIVFSDYSVDEMYQIFTAFLNGFNGRVYLLDEDAKKLLLENFALEKRSRSFGNARTVRNAVDAIMDYHADRLMSSGKKTDDNRITVDDIKAYTDARNLELRRDVRNTAAANQVDESIIRVAELKPKTHAGIEDPEGAINQLIGLEAIKEQLQLLTRQKDFYGNVEKQKLNFVFVGEDEHVKTDVLKLLTGHLYKLGYIRDNRYMDISAEFLKGAYVGHTARRAEAIVSYATGGVLYVRNLSQLCENNADSFSREVMNVLSSMLESDLELCIVLAETRENMVEFLRQNPVVQSHIQYKFIFAAYSDDDMMQLFAQMCKTDGFNVSNEDLKLILDYFGTCESKTYSTVRSFYEQLKHTHITSDFTQDDKYLFTSAEISNAISIPKKPTTKLKLNF